MGKHLTDVEYKVRMMQELKDKIVASAKEHNRSMNADIVARLEQTFKSQNLLEEVSFNKIMATFADRLAEMNLSFLIVTQEQANNLNAESGRHLLVNMTDEQRKIK